MSRTPIVAGNWKMNLLRADAIALARDVRDRAGTIAGVETIVCPPFVFLHEVAAILAGSTVEVGAQDLYWEEKGAFTGEVSVTQVAEAARFAIVGHSERRQFFGETDDTVNRRLKAALAHGLQPIMCVGELLDDRQGGRTADVLVRQTRVGLAGVEITGAITIAYEPVWAIGTGLAADGPTAQEAIGLIRATVRELAGAAAMDVRILYGGSVIPNNAAEFMAQPDIDGSLVGGASLKADVFAAIVRMTAAAATARP
ncbi:MAG TPA: triose-phosphate isomerase [Dehalococcoidia bacterium]|nr:triose-phosphate isomerase [Dehalococcoidia bacterium]